jgi:hypothetical protein
MAETTEDKIRGDEMSIDSLSRSSKIPGIDTAIRTDQVEQSSTVVELLKDTAKRTASRTNW